MANPVISYIKTKGASIKKYRPQMQRYTWDKSPRRFNFAGHHIPVV